jgi:hypothetical protein
MPQFKLLILKELELIKGIAIAFCYIAICYRWGQTSTFNSSFELKAILLNVEV